MFQLVNCKKSFDNLMNPQKPYLITVIVVAALFIVGIIIALINGRKPMKCHVMLFEQPPVDSMDNLTESEQYMIKTFSNEDFRVSPSASSGGPRFSGGGGPSSGGGGWSGGGGGHHGGGGRSGGGGGGWWGWPDYYWQRPWRVPLWQMYPEYIPTYPLTYYTDEWTTPITRYTVRIGPKSDENPFKGKGSDVGFMISAGPSSGCGTSGARLNLKRGKTYEFDIYTSKDCVTGEARDDAFYFTTDPTGGKRVGDIFATEPITNGVLRITIADETPNQFYYQSSKNPNVGSVVFVHS